MERRKFIQLSALGSASSLFLDGHQIKAFSKTDLINNIPAEIIDGRSLVLIQLSGGNDGLNTIIPSNQYDKYANLRPTIKINNTGSNKGITLDSTLPLKDQLLLHPSLTAFKTLYDAGKLNIIHGVGYPILNKSHFAGTAIILNGGDGTSENANKSNGWMARFLHADYNAEEYQDPLGIQLGSKKPSLGFHSEHEHKVDVNLAGQDISGYYSVISNIGNPLPNAIPNSEFGENLQFIGNTETATNSYSKRISEVFNKGKNSTITYPQYDLADQLKTVAKMIQGGSKTKVYLVHLGGFDTHANQVASTTDSHLGKHADLLKELGESVLAFQNDLTALGIADKVISATFTEFGRKPAENGNLGCDHGTLGPMFVIGSNVKGGVSGNTIDLTNVTGHYDENQMQFDYRQTFTTLISDFLGASTDVISATEFSEFDGTKKMNLIQENAKAINNLSTEKPIETTEITIYPNPVQDLCYVKYSANELFRGYVVLYSLNGEISFQIQKDFTPETNIIQLNIEHLKTGIYILAIKDNYNKTIRTSKLIKQ